MFVLWSSDYFFCVCVNVIALISEHKIKEKGEEVGRWTYKVWWGGRVWSSPVLCNDKDQEREMGGEGRDKLYIETKEQVKRG